VTTLRRALVLAAVGAAAAIVGAVLDPRRAAVSWLVALVAVWSTVLGALALVMIAHVTGATWFVLLRRRAEDAIATLPVLALLFVPVAIALRALYPWAAPLEALSPAVRAAVVAKRAYLDAPFFVGRAVVYWGAWVALAESLRRLSLRQDRAAGDAEALDLARRMRRVSAAGLPALALTLTFASFDWMMSLSPAWSSTLYGVYVFAGGAVGALALLALLGVPNGSSSGVEQRHALGKLLLTFVLLWAYLGYSQLIVIWSADLPREVAWYVARRGGWDAVAALLVVGHLIVPTLALFVRAVKRSALLLGALGAWLLAMHYVDVYWLVLPERTPGHVAPHWLDLATLAAVTGATVATAVWRRGAEPAVPERDPRLPEALAYDADG
jgi:hypothetical protein